MVRGYTLRGKLVWIPLGVCVWFACRNLFKAPVLLAMGKECFLAYEECILEQYLPGSSVYAGEDAVSRMGRLIATEFIEVGRVNPYWNGMLAKEQMTGSGREMENDRHRIAGEKDNEEGSAKGNTKGNAKENAMENAYENAEGNAENNAKKSVNRKSETGTYNPGDGASEEGFDFEAFERENQAALEVPFVPHQKRVVIDRADLMDYETLVKKFYTVDGSTMAGTKDLDAKRFLGTDLTLSNRSEGEPEILIYHTHSQESFADSIPGDVDTTIVGVGEELARILEEEYGYCVLHHRGEYDRENRNAAYSKALPALEQILEEYPSIQVIIDLHRDEMQEDNRLVMDLDGRKTARIMFFNGMSRTKQSGEIAYLLNENRDANLAFSFQMQLKSEEYYPGLARKIYLKSYRYNMHLLPRTMLVELGAQNNTVEEAYNACEPLAHLLDMVLSGEE